MAQKNAAPKKKPAAKKKTPAKKKPAAKPAVKPSVNKSQAIRDFAKDNPKAGPTEIAAALKKEGIDISPAFVSTVRTLAKKSKRGGRRKAAGKVAGKVAAAKPASDKISISSLLSAKKLVEDVGGLEKARAALAALAKLQ